MKALCEEMGLNTCATPNKYLAAVLIPSAVKNSTNKLYNLNTQTTSAFPLIESLVHISQLQKFHKVMIEQPPAEFDG